MFQFLLTSNCTISFLTCQLSLSSWHFLNESDIYSVMTRLSSPPLVLIRSSPECLNCFPPHLITCLTLSQLAEWKYFIVSIPECPTLILTTGPFSVLSIFSKLFEKHVHSLCVVLEHNLISKSKAFFLIARHHQLSSLPFTPFTYFIKPINQYVLVFFT